MAGAVSAAASDRFRIHLTSAADVVDLERQFRDAAPRTQFVYASGYTLPRKAPVVALVREWTEAGLATLTTAKAEHDKRLTNWIVVKLEQNTAASGVGEPRSGAAAREGRVVRFDGDAPRPDLMREQMRSLMNRFRHFAARGEQCPSYAKLAEWLALGRGPRARERVRTLVRRLEREKQISVTPGDAQRPFVITILAPGRARGKSTKGGE